LRPLLAAFTRTLISVWKLKMAIVRSRVPLPQERPAQVPIWSSYNCSPQRYQTMAYSKNILILAPSASYWITGLSPTSAVRLLVRWYILKQLSTTLRRCQPLASWLWQGPSLSRRPTSLRALRRAKSMGVFSRLPMSRT